MSQTIKIENYSSINTPQATVLTADLAVGVNSISVANTNDFAVGDYIVVGRIGSNSSEMLTIGAVTPATSITTTTNTTLTHKRLETVTKLLGNQIKVYRAANVNGSMPADAAFSLNGSANIDIPGLTTTYNDSTGGSNYWYKFTYYNSTTASETQLSDSKAMRGGGVGHYVSIDDIRYEAGMVNNKNISDSIINSRRIDGENEINSELIGIYALPFTDPVPAVISQANRLISAGLLLQTEYGPMATGGKVYGSDKLQEGRDLLAKIKSRELVLADAQGNSTLVQPLVSSWPNANTDQTGANVGPDTAASNSDDFGPAFRKAQRF